MWIALEAITYLSGRVDMWCLSETLLVEFIFEVNE